jgi:hypothetical protein
VMGPMGIINEVHLFEEDAKDARLATDEEEQEELEGRSVTDTTKKPSTSSSWAVTVTVVVCLCLAAAALFMYKQEQFRRMIPGYSTVTTDSLEMDPLAGYTDSGYVAPDVPLGEEL